MHITDHQPCVIPREPVASDDLAGASSRVVYEVRIADGQHDKLMPQDKEVQHGVYGDTSTCTNHACSSSIDTQGNWMLDRGLIGEADVKRLTDYGFIVGGRFNTSERYNAIKSGTKHRVGNYLYKPWDSARNDGMVPEVLLPYPHKQRVPVFSVEEYFDADVEKRELKEAAEVFDSVFEVQYEIVPKTLSSLKLHLFQAPIAIIAGVCSPWDGSVIPACELDSGHATLLYGWKDLQYLKDFDSYLPNEKKLAWDYKIGYAIKGVLLLRDRTKVIPYLPYFEQKRGQKGIAVYDPDTDKLIAFGDGRYFKALFGGYGKVKVVGVKEWSRDINEVLEVVPFNG